MAIDASFLDGQQYTTASIRTYETVYGRDFVSPGGKETALALTTKLGLKPRQKVLDVGCGLGGGSFLMASQFDAQVDGIDLSHNMINAAANRLTELKLSTRVTLWQGDCLELDRPGTYDAIYSRDVFLHIHDKSQLFSTLHRSLKERGKLLFTDYCCGSPPWTEEFESYVAQRRYCLHTVPEYEAILISAGFSEVRAQDRTEEFTAILEGDLACILASDLDAVERDYLAVSWQAKIDRAVRGEQRWGLFEMVK